MNGHSSSEHNEAFERDRHDPWDPPHEDGQEYITGVIKLLEDDCLGAQLRLGDGDMDAGPTHIDTYPPWKLFRTGFLANLPRNPADPYWVADWHEGGSDVDDEDFYIGDLLAAARHALQTRALEDLADCVGRLWDYTVGVSSSDALASFDPVSSWVAVLDGEPVDDSTEEEAIEKLVIAKIHELSEYLCELVAAKPSALRHIEWRELERVVATALAGLGFDVLLTPPSRDAGKDVIASCMMKGRKHTYFIEIKHWRSGKRVGARTIFDFVEVNLHGNTDGGLFLSSSGFAESVFSQIGEVARYWVRLGGQQKIVSLCQYFVRCQAGLWIARGRLPVVLYEGTV